MSGAKTTLRILELARVLTLAWAIQKGSSVWKVCVLEKGLTIKRLGSSNRFFEPPLASKMHSHLVELARVLALAWAIQKGSSVWKVCVLEKGLTIKRLGSSNRFFEPPLASKMHSHLVEPARVLTLAWAIQKG